MEAATATLAAARLSPAAGPARGLRRPAPAGARARPAWAPRAARLVVRAAGSPEGGAKKLTYKEAGVDIDAGDELVRRIAKMAPGIGGFGGFFPFGDSFLVAGTDGVGTKLKLAFDLKKHDTVGIDLVAMSVNDVVTTGAKPLFFLDYFATGKLDVDTAEMVVKGIVDGCKQSECALLGGETAEMPGFYSPGEYDLAGFAVGVVKKDDVIDGRKVQVGDKLIGLASSGVHSNGFSLVRRILKDAKVALTDPLPGTSGTIGQALMAPTIIYVRQVLQLAAAVEVRALSHITGEGLPGNVPRVLPEGTGCTISMTAWERPPLFKFLQKAGGDIDDAEMFRTFNMGIGMVVVVAPAVAADIAAGKYPFLGPAAIIGEVINGKGVTLTP